MMLGHCIFHLLRLLSASSPPPSNQIHTHALLALCALAGLNPDPISAEATPTDLLAAPEAFLQGVSGRVGAGGRVRRRVFASFLPGASVAITRLLTSDARTVRGVVTLGLLTWAHYVAIVMSDEGVVEGEESVGVAVDVVEAEEQWEGPEEGVAKEKVQPVERTEAWWAKTAENLSLLVERMCVLVTSDAWKVRLYLVGWAHTLLTRCSM